MTRGAPGRQTERVTEPSPIPAPPCERSWFRRLCDALAYVARPEHLRSTLRIALVVGVVLTLINQADVILAGDATAATWLKCGLNFLVPFVVANLGLLTGARRATDPEARSSG